MKTTEQELDEYMKSDESRVAKRLHSGELEAAIRWLCKRIDDLKTEALKLRIN